VAAAVRLPRSASGKTAVQVARRIAREGGGLARIANDRPKAETSKGRGNVVTETDFAVETLVQQILEAEYPRHGFLSEETHADTKANGWVWVLDPVDGTRNFASAIPNFCINVALCLDGVTQVGLTYDPLRREEFLAVRGRGLRVNGQPAAASTKAKVADSVVCFDTSFDDDRGRHALQTMLALWPGVQAMRIIGSAALGLAWAACGRFDLFVQPYLQPWDIVAGLLQIEEAGGRITDRDGAAAHLFSNSVLAGSRSVHADFLRLTAGQPWHS
jgi:myo-inositol-1(or 4)-monophosphatase